MIFDVRTPPPFSVNSLAERWECSPSMIRKLIKQGKLQHFRIGELMRISQETVEAYERGAEGMATAVDHVADAHGALAIPDPTVPAQSLQIRVGRKKRATPIMGAKQS